MSAERRVDGALFGSSVETLRRRRRSKRVWFDASESPEAERSARPFQLRVGPSLIADVPRGERVHQRGLDLHAQGDLLPRRAPHAAARREPDGRHAASSRARARRDRARDGDVQRRRRHGLERRGPTSGERKGWSRDGRLRDSLRASSVWRDDARPDAPNRSRGKKAVGGSRKRGHLIHSAPSRGSSRPACGKFLETQVSFGFGFFRRGTVDIFARFGPDRPRIAIGNADQTLAVNVPPPRPNRFARARCRHNAPRPDARRGARESAGARVAEVGEAPSLPGVESRTDSRGAREAHRRTAPDARIPDGKRHRRTFHRGIDGDRARRSTDKRFDRETQTHARVRGASRDKAPGTGPCSVASARSPRPIRASNARLVSFFPNARDTLARRGTFLSRREAHGVGARFDRSIGRAPANDPAPPRRPSPRVPAPAAAFGEACRPRASRAPRVPAFSLTAKRPPLERNRSFRSSPDRPHCRPDESAGEKKRRHRREPLLSCHVRQFFIGSRIY